MPLELCPTSNIRLGVYADFAAHPLRQLWDSGLIVTVNSDDPPLFETDLNQEYAILIEHFDFGADELEQASLNAVLASFLPQSEKLVMAGDFSREFATLRQEIG